MLTNEYEEFVKELAKKGTFLTIKTYVDLNRHRQAHECLSFALFSYGTYGVFHPLFFFWTYRHSCWFVNVSNTSKSMEPNTLASMLVDISASYRVVSSPSVKGKLVFVSLMDRLLTNSSSEKLNLLYKLVFTPPWATIEGTELTPRWDERVYGQATNSHSAVIPTPLTSSMYLCSQILRMVWLDMVNRMLSRSPLSYQFTRSLELFCI